MSPLPAQTPNPAAHPTSPRFFPGGVGYRPLLRLACLQLAPQLPGILGDHRVQATRARLPHASNTGPRQPGQMPNENSGNAACNRTSSARIHGGAACLPRNSDLVSSARPQSYQCACTAPPASWSRAGGVSSSPAATDQPGFRMCPEPWHSMQERRTHSAWPRLSVPTVQARRERWNFHPWPRQARQISCWSSVLRMRPRFRHLVTNPLHSGFSR